MLNWIKQSNRKKHLFYGWLISLLGTITAGTAAALTAEFKDKQWGGKFDWLDVAATEIGAIVGQLTQCGIIYMIYHMVK